MNKKIINFDTYENNWKQTGTAFNYSIPLGIALYNVNSISLKSIEMPNLLYNVRTNNTSNVIYIQYTYSSVTTKLSVNIPSSNYTDINTLIMAINTALVAAIPVLLISSVQAYIKLSNLTDYLRFNSNIPVYGFSSDSVLLNNILGFNAYSTCTYSGITTDYYINSVNLFNLQPDTYISMQFTNLTINTNRNNNAPQHFKIPINTAYGGIQFFNDNNQFFQTLDMLPINLSYLNMNVVDRWGNNLLLYYDFSFSLSIEYNGLF